MKNLSMMTEKARDIASDRMRVARFTRMLQALVDEGVPITEKEAICETFAERAGDSASMDDLLCAVRSLPDVARALPANHTGARLLELSPEIEKALRRSLIPLGDEHVLAIEPEFTQEVLTAIRNVVSESAFENSTPGKAIVVRDDRTRRYVRRLVELEFPDLYTLSELELVGPLREVPRTAIALE